VIKKDKKLHKQDKDIGNISSITFKIPILTACYTYVATPGILNAV